MMDTVNTPPFTSPTTVVSRRCSLGDTILLLASLHAIGVLLYQTSALAPTPVTSSGVASWIQASFFVAFVCLHVVHDRLPSKSAWKANGTFCNLVAASIPLNVVLGIQATLLYFTPTVVELHSPPTFVGGLLLALGLALIVVTEKQLIQEGQGTLSPAPSLQTHCLVVTGVYAYWRNPMIVGAGCVLAGLACLFQSRVAACFTLGFLVVKTLWFALREEPDLAVRFGEEYLHYKRSTSRWWPRTTPYYCK